MNYIASRLNLRLLIDGIEVPVIGARCTFSEGGPATAQIQVVATDALWDIYPRAAIALLVYEPPGLDENGQQQNYSPYDLRNYKCMFTGELIGIGFTKQTGSRSAVLSCIDQSNYIDVIKQHFFNFANGGVEFFENAFMGVNLERMKFFDVCTKDVTSNVYVWLMNSKYKDPETGKSWPSLYLGTQRLLRELWFASNTFYSQAFNRWRFGDCVVGLPSDRTAAQLFNLDFFQKFIQNRLGNAGGYVSARQCLQVLLGTVFHDFVTIPCPRLDPAAQSLGWVPGQGTSSGERDTLSKLIINREAHAGASLNQFVIKPDSWFFVPPACNIILPHMYDALTFQRDYLAEPTRLFLRTSLIFTGKDKWVTERFYAPAEPEFESFDMQLYAEGGYLTRLSRILLEHEKFVGINGVETWQEDLGAYVQKGDRRSYLSKFTDYMYWKFRFSTRTANVSGPLNLNVVPGYPVLVIDRMAPGVTNGRHYLGNAQAVVHSIDQNGGWTYITMSGVRLHDEIFDPDKKNRPLEEILATATNGYLDDRYDYNNVGEQVYKPLFGCGSLLDTTLGSTGGKFEVGDKGPISSAVEALGFLYNAALDNEADISLFTRALTYRPKANFVDLFGLPSSTANMNDEDRAGLVATSAAIDMSKPANEGFHSILVDSTAHDFQNDTYTDDDDKKASYGLQDFLTQRQAKVQAYADSIKNRGMRG